MAIVISIPRIPKNSQVLQESSKLKCVPIQVCFQISIRLLFSYLFGSGMLDPMTNSRWHSTEQEFGHWEGGFLFVYGLAIKWSFSRSQPLNIDRKHHSLFLMPFHLKNRENILTNSSFKESSKETSSATIKVTSKCIALWLICSCT